MCFLVQPKLWSKAWNVMQTDLVMAMTAERNEFKSLIGSTHEIVTVMSVIPTDGSCPLAAVCVIVDGLLDLQKIILRLDD